MGFLSISKLVLPGLWLLSAHLTLTCASVCPLVDTFDWESIAPKDCIEWTPCYTTMFCARLKVPLDYTNPQGDELAIALLKVPANISTSDPAYRGPILLNPGGPGGSGVDVALEMGPAAQTIVGADFDIIGFDPRGVGRTTPGVDAFRGAELQKQVWSLRDLDIPPIDDSTEALPRTIAIRKLTNTLLADKTAHISPYVGTAAVARDMLSILEALGQDKLQYWGVSYGSVLGMTFASLFPDKVKRIIVDGIVDASAWYKGNYTESFRDTDSIISIVAKQCAATTSCPLHAATGEDVEKRLFNIFESLRTNVVTVYGVALYSPYTSMGPLFQALADLEKGDGLTLYSLAANFTDLTVTCRDCDHPLTVADPGASPDAGTAIQCADSSPISDDLGFLKSVYNALAARTRTAETAFSISVRCVGWSLKSKSRFEGAIGGNTSFPLLFIGNTHDYITPLQSALTMSTLFNGSSVLTRDAIGHTSFSGTSLCTYMVARAYLRDGVLPSPGTICGDITEEVFGASTSTNKTASTTTKRTLGLRDLDLEEQIIEAGKVLSSQAEARFNNPF